MLCRDSRSRPGGGRSRILLLAWLGCAARVAVAVQHRGGASWGEVGLQFPTARLEARTLRQEGVASVQEAEKLLDTSAVSCVLFDEARHAARFSVAPRDLYDPAELAGDFQNAFGWRCKAATNAPAAIMVPTYPRHQGLYDRLVASVKKYVMGNGTPLISVFSSIEESYSMTASCGACKSSHEVRMRSLVFNHPYTNHTTSNMRTTYQTAKKLWAIATADDERVLMVDSDFSILRPIQLAEAIAPYEHVLYEVPRNHFHGGIFNNMLSHLWRLFHTNRSLDVVTFEPPWIYDRGHVGSLVAFIEQETGGNFVDYMLHMKIMVYEVLMYRAFVLAKDPGFYSRHVPLSKFWFEDTESAESERLAVDPPPIVVKHWKQNNGQPCSICWLEAHADRGQMK